MAVRRRLRRGPASAVLATGLALLVPLARAGGAPADVWLEASVEPAQTYLHAQAVYTLRLYQSIDLRELRFLAPATGLAELRPIDGGRIAEVARDGHRYRVTTQRYAAFPFASGELVLDGARVEGFAPARAAPLRLDAPPVRLSVLPIPPGADASAWVPARALTLDEQWVPDGDAAVEVGTPLRRTIRIRATGVQASRLPALDPAAGGVVAHAAPPRLEDRLDGPWTVATREQSWQLVPRAPGIVELPALRLQWWDAAAAQLRTAELPARRLVVVAAAAAPPAPAAAATATPAPGPAPAPRVVSTATSPGGGPRALALAAAAAIALALSAAFARRRRRALPRLRAACRRNDPGRARDALLQLGRERWPDAPPRSLSALADRLTDPRARAAVAALDRHLYGDGDDWPRHELAARSRAPARLGAPCPPLSARKPPVHDSGMTTPSPTKPCR